MTSINIRFRSNADTRRACARTIRIPGAYTVTQTGTKTVRVETSYPEKVEAWCEESFHVEFYGWTDEE